MKDKFVKTLSDGAQVVIHRWVPEGDIKAVVVLSHGMAEYAERYTAFAEMLNANGYVFYAEDKRGHGDTADLAVENGTGAFGYLADKNGFLRVRDDLFEEVQEVRKTYPGKKVFIFAHSFGSFVGQAFIETYGREIDGIVLCGTAGPRKLLMGAAKFLGSVIKLFRGKKNVSGFLNKLAFGAYNDRIEQRRTGYDWLSRRDDIVDAYIADRRCGFLCTIGFFNDMFDGFKFVHDRKNIAKIPDELPVHLIYGTADPVGDYGKTVEDLYSIYKAKGLKNADIVKYEGARHELLNETNGEEVMQELLAWFNRIA